ncbi:MAG TPA: glycosyltransferase family 9 protein [Longimicrobiales bacterium]|nr:glycosyltransferase family 9 protein [Longimicrobiales bacterium]
MMSNAWNGPPPREICIVMLSAIGDAVHVLPVANGLKRAWPESRITWIVQPVPHTLVAGHESIDEFVVFRRRRGWRALESYYELANNLKGKRFDLLLALQVYLKAGLIAALVPARIKLGFDRRRARDLQWIFTNRRIPPHPPQHVQDQYFEFLEYLGVDPRPVTWGLKLTSAEREAQAAFFGRLGAPACAVVVATSKPEKNWEPGRYAKLLERLEREHGLRPVLVGGPAPAERRVADRVLAATRAHAVDALGDDLRRLMWLLDGSDLVISPDTGPLHIARALERPVVGLFGHTNPRRTGPYRAYEDLIVDGYAAHEGERYPITAEHRGGMGRVTVDAVMEKVARAMAERASPRPDPASG